MTTKIAQLPHEHGAVFLTDSGLETSLIFHESLDLPHFASFVLLKSDDGRARLKRYFSRHARIAEAYGTGFVWESITWRASADWGAKLGYDAHALAAANRDAVSLMQEVAADFDIPGAVSGNIGPRGDGYLADTAMSVRNAADYHAPQIETLADAGVDMVSAFTLSHTAEAVGIARSAARIGVPCVLSFTLETDGHLPSGEPLGEAITRVDNETGASPIYYMINCAHPAHFSAILEPGAAWMNRIKGLRANASTRSHAELDEARDLDAGDPQALGNDYARLLRSMPWLTVLGGCCGTDARHVAEIAKSCLSSSMHGMAAQ